MSELIFVSSDNCELCKKAENKIKFLKPFYQIREVDAQEDHKEFLLRVPVLLKNNKVIEEGIFSRLTVLRNLILFSAFLHNSQLSVVTKINSDMYYVLMRPWTLVFIILLVLIIFISGSIAISNLRL